MSELSEYNRLNLRKASLLRAAPAVLMGRPGETRPGPMQLACQFPVTTAPAVPELMKDLAWVTLFVDLESGEFGEANGEGWVLRTYSSAEELIPLSAGEGIRDCRWQAADDYPSLDDPERVVPEGFDDAAVEMESLQQTKLGGWPSNIESAQWWQLEDHPARPKYCFQVVSDEKTGLEFGDGGILYFARGTAPGCEAQWFLDLQAY